MDEPTTHLDIPRRVVDLALERYEGTLIFISTTSISFVNSHQKSSSQRRRDTLTLATTITSRKNRPLEDARAALTAA